MFVSGGTLDLVGCKFLENSADDGVSDDLNNLGGTVNIDGCPAGFSGAAGAALDTSNHDGATVTGEAKSFSCGVCVR